MNTWGARFGIRDAWGLMLRLVSVRLFDVVLLAQSWLERGMKGAKKLRLVQLSEVGFGRTFG